MYGIHNINTVITFGKYLFFNIILYPLKMTIHEQQYLLFNIRLGGVRLRLGLMGKLDCAWVYGWWPGGVINSIPSITVKFVKTLLHKITHASLPSNHPCTTPHVQPFFPVNPNPTPPNQAMLELYDTTFMSPTIKPIKVTQKWINFRIIQVCWLIFWWLYKKN